MPREAFLSHPLTYLELTTLQFIADGMSNEEAARILVVSVHTVNRRLQGIYAKMGLDSRVGGTTRASAVATGFRLELLL